MLMVMMSVLRSFGEVDFACMMLVETRMHFAFQHLGLAAGRKHVTRFERDKCRQ
jgi:hypothetical protein